MIFANPCGLLWGLTAVLVVVLYLRRVRLRREGVATGMFWERAFAEERLRTAWRKWRRGVSATVQLIALGLIVAALADPQIPGPRRIVLIVDNSAGMRAADVQPTRLAEAKQAAQRLIAGLRPCDRMAILSAGPAVSVRASLTNERRRLNNVLDEVDVSTGRGSSGVPAAAELARRMLARAPGGKIQVVTDGCFRGARELAEADDVELIRVGRPTGNAAVTRLAARRMPTDPTRCQVLVEVRNFSDRPVECLLKIESTTGQSLESVPLKLDRNGRRQEFFEITAPESVRIAVELDHSDVYAEDNVAVLEIPPPSAVARGADGAIDFRAGLDAAVVEFSGWGESDLRAVGDFGRAAARMAAQRPGRAPRLLLVVAGLLLLTLEWCFYQRRWIC